MRRWTALVTSTVFFGNSVATNTFPDPTSSVEPRSDPLENITVVESGQFVVAKLQCYDCPTTARVEKGVHEITHEENALVCISTLHVFYQIPMPLVGLLLMCQPVVLQHQPLKQP
jgi:hypothetical protein